MNKAKTPQQIAHQYGYKYEFIKAACDRVPDEHPLPHIRRGNSRPVIYIQPSTFEKWLEEEERLTVGLSDAQARDSLQAIMQNIWKEYRDFEYAVDEFKEELSA